MNTSSSNTKYFDLHTRGVGYVNRVREVKVKGSSPYLACTIAAVRGEADAIEYTYFDCNVVGKEAIEEVRKLMSLKVDDKTKILAGFTIGDISPVTFTYSQGAKKGDTGVSLKGRLLRFSFVEVDGKRVYEAPAPTALQSVSKQNDKPEVDTQVGVADAGDDDNSTQSDDAELGSFDVEEQMSYARHVAPENEFPKLAFA